MSLSMCGKLYGSTITVIGKSSDFKTNVVIITSPDIAYNILLCYNI